MAQPALSDATIRQAVLVERLKSGEVRKFETFLREIDRNLREQLTRVDLTTIKRRRLEALLSEIDGMLLEVLTRFTEQFELDLEQLAAVESVSALHLLDEAGVAYALPSAEHVWTAIKVEPLQAGKGKLLKGFIEDWSASEREAVAGAIRLGIAQGQTNAEIVKAIRGTAALNYADGLLDVTRRHAEAVVRTSVAHVAAISRRESYAANDDIFAGSQWDSTLDHRTCARCQALDGEQWPLDKGPVEPLHPNCLPGDALVFARSGIAGVSKRWFDGKMAVIRTASGRVLTCTPNHPVLTDGGWVSAETINLGDNVISDGGSEWAGGINSDDKDVPARIHEVADAFFSSIDVSSMPVPVSAPDFHGDGMDGDVAVVGAYRPLRNGGDATLAQHIQQRDLVIGCAVFPGGVGARAHGLFGGSMFAALDGFMRGFCQFLALIRRHASHAGELLLASVSRRDASVAERALQDHARCADAVGDGSDADAGVEQRQGGGHVGIAAFDELTDAHLCASCAEASVYRSPADAELASKIIRGDAGFVFADKVVDVDVRDFSGHVYNLETVEGWYSAGGIVTHNCRCVRVPVLSDEFAWLQEGEMRSSTDGPVSGKLTYYEWLKRQTPEFQDAALGKKRGDLFRNGGLSVEKFSALQLDRRWEPLTLDEIKKLAPDAFKRAGIK